MACKTMGTNGLIVPVAAFSNAITSSPGAGIIVSESVTFNRAGVTLFFRSFNFVSEAVTLFGATVTSVSAAFNTIWGNITLFWETVTSISVTFTLISVTSRHVTEHVRVLPVTLQHVPKHVRIVSVTLQHVIEHVRVLSVTIQDVLEHVRILSVSIQHVPKHVRVLPVTLQQVTEHVRVLPEGVLFNPASVPQAFTTHQSVGAPAKVQKINSRLISVRNTEKDCFSTRYSQCRTLKMKDHEKEF